jgi:CheY-like chemotaxis protein
MSMDRVLVVCDDASTSQTLQLLLAGAGYEVRCTASTDRALALSRSFGPRLLLVDAELPESGGLELVRRVKSDPVTRAIVVVVLTPNPSESHERQVLAVGADRCVLTPVLGPNLLFALSSQLGTTDAPPVTL